MPNRKTLAPRALSMACFSVAVLALWMAASPADAASAVAKELAAIDAKMKRCLDKDSSTVGMKQCTYDATTSADKVLNKVYQATIASLKKPSDEQEAKDDKEKLARLLASEVAWIKYRDTDCDLQGISMLGGTGEGLVTIGCQYSMTTKRVKDLDELFNPEN